jgi:phage-related protein
MASVYDTVYGWAQATIYSKYNIVSGSNSKYYYSLIDNNVGVGNNPTTNANLQVNWDGYKLFNSSFIPNFFWQPSYQSSAKIEPRVKKIQFGNGYQQRVPDGINFELKNLNLSFENRSEVETVSILHFLEQRGGQQSFAYNVPTIYAKPSGVSKFVAPNWETNYNFYNSYSIKTVFEEVPN